MNKILIVVSIGIVAFSVLIGLLVADYLYDENRRQKIESLYEEYNLKWHECNGLKDVSEYDRCIEELEAIMLELSKGIGVATPSNEE